MTKTLTRNACTDSLQKPLRIALLLQDLEFGGTQRYAINIIKHLDRTVFNPELWVLRGGMEMSSLAKAAGIAPIWLSRHRRVGPYALARMTGRLLRHRPEILYTLTVVPNIWGRLAGRVSRVPVIVSGWRSLFPRQHERILWRLSNRVICNGSVLKNIMLEAYGVNPDRIAVIPNGVDTEYFSADHREEPTDPLLLYVGRLVPEKDPLTLLQAFRGVLTRFPSARLLMVGDGPLRGRIEESILVRRLHRSVAVMKGAVDIRPEMARAWVLVMSSVREASPNVVFEAMACGLPVVAPRVGSIPEAVLHGETGFLYEPARPDSLACFLNTLLANEPLRRSMSLRARERALRCFSIDRMIRETERVLLEAAQDAGRNGRRV